jgi:hypothetical protein
MGEEITSGAVATNDLAGCHYLERRCRICRTAHGYPAPAEPFAGARQQISVGIGPVRANVTALEDVGLETKFHQSDFFHSASCFASETMNFKPGRHRYRPSLTR